MQSLDDLRQENERLAQINLQVMAALDEMRIETACTNGEGKKPDDMEKKLLLAREQRILRLYKAATKRLQDRSMLDNIHYMDMLVKLPAKSLSEVIEHYKSEPLALTTYQPPYFLEFANKAWSELCEWQPHEVCGSTLAFMQGPQTDREVVNVFMEQVEAFGYGCMTVINYTKSRKPFIVTVKVFPVYDSICATGCDSDQPILTHLATTFTNIVDVGQTFDNSETRAWDHVKLQNQPLFTDGPRAKGDKVLDATKQPFTGKFQTQTAGSLSCGDLSSSNSINSNSNGNRVGGDVDPNLGNTIAQGQKRTRMEPTGSKHASSGNSSSVEAVHTRCPSPGLGDDDLDQKNITKNCQHNNSGGSNTAMISRTQSARMLLARLSMYVLTPADFIKCSQTARLSDILRLMVVCRNAIVVTDISGRIIHANRTWTELTGFSVAEVEGLTCQILQGAATDHNEVSRCMETVRGGHLSQMEVVNYRKDGSAYITTVIITPLQGAYMNPAVTHYYAMLVPKET